MVFGVVFGYDWLIWAGTGLSCFNFLIGCSVLKLSIVGGYGISIGTVFEYVI